jgi:hypothetical protein
MGLAALVGVGLIAFYLSTYAVHRFRAPLGWDAPGYSWRTALARAGGVSALPSKIPPPGPVNPGRPGFVVVGGLLSSLMRLHPLRVAELFPAVMAATAGLAAGVVVSVGLRRPRWQAMAVSLGVGTSMFMVRAINAEGYQDNVLALAILTAALTPILLSVRDGRAVVPGGLLLGATGLAHWNVLEVGLAVVGLAALVYIPGAVRAMRNEGRRLMDTPPIRLATSAAMGAALAVVGIVGLLTAPIPYPRIDVGQFLGKVRRDLPAYRLPFTLSAAAVGAVAMAGTASDPDEEGRRSRAFLVLMLAWCEVTVLAFVGQWALGRGIPGHRVLAICLAIPILGVLGLVWIGQRLRRLWRPLAAATVIAGMGASAFFAQAEWSSYRPVVSAAQLTQGATAARYLEAASVDPGRPVVFVVDSREADAWSDLWLAAHTLRAALPASRTREVYVFVGQPDDYLAERPTVLTEGDQGPGIAASQYEGISALYYGALIDTYQRDPVAVILASANPAFDAWAVSHPGSLVGPGVAVVRGPQLPRPIPAAPDPAGGPGGLGLAAASLMALVLLGITGACLRSGRAPGGGRGVGRGGAGAGRVASLRRGPGGGPRRLGGRSGGRPGSIRPRRI